MTLLELSGEYRRQASVLRGRMEALSAECKATADQEERGALQERIRILTELWREARDLAVLTERYYERGYRRNGRYTL